MRSAEFNHAWRTAQRQLWAGWFAAAATLFARLTTVGLQLSRGHLNVADFGLAVLKSGLLIAVVCFYPRHRWPAYLMLSVWPFGFIFAWTLAHAPPAAMAVGLLVGVAFFSGARGARQLHALRAAARSAAPAI
jgi:hypothetical protein